MSHTAIGANTAKLGTQLVALRDAAAALVQTATNARYLQTFAETASVLTLVIPDAGEVQYVVVGICVLEIAWIPLVAKTSYAPPDAEKAQSVAVMATVRENARQRRAARNNNCDRFA